MLTIFDESNHLVELVRENRVVDVLRLLHLNPAHYTLCVDTRPLPLLAHFHDTELIPVGSKLHIKRARWPERINMRTPTGRAAWKRFAESHVGLPMDNFECVRNDEWNAYCAFFTPARAAFDVVMESKTFLSKTPHHYVVSAPKPKRVHFVDHLKECVRDARLKQALRDTCSVMRTLVECVKNCEAYALDNVLEGAVYLGDKGPLFEYGMGLRRTRIQDARLVDVKSSLSNACEFVAKIMRVRELESALRKRRCALFGTLYADLVELLHRQQNLDAYALLEAFEDYLVFFVQAHLEEFVVPAVNAAAPEPKRAKPTLAELAQQTADNTQRALLEIQDELARLSGCVIMRDHVNCSESVRAQYMVCDDSSSE